MSERERLVAAALGEKGAKGGEKYVLWYNQATGAGFARTAAWCAIFVSWCAHQAGLTREQVPLFASCTAGRRQLQALGVWRERESGTPRRGDLVLFDWDGDPALAEHVGIVTGADDRYLYTVEGNSGGTVRERRYGRHSAQVLGYGAWREKEEMNLTKAETQALIDQSVQAAKAELAAYTDRGDAAVMAEAKRYARQEVGGTHKVYHTAAETPEWARETVERLVAAGQLRGDERGDLQLTQEMLRVLVIVGRKEGV